MKVAVMHRLKNPRKVITVGGLGYAVMNAILMLKAELRELNECLLCVRMRDVSVNKYEVRGRWCGYSEWSDEWICLVELNGRFRGEGTSV